MYWGSQWNNNDPSGEAAIQQNFFNHVGGSHWNNSVTQYCQGVASGTITCGSAGTHAGEPSGVLWRHLVRQRRRRSRRIRPRRQLAAEAQAAAAHFGNTSATANHARAVRDQHRDRQQRQWLRHPVLCLAQLHQLELRQYRLHQHAVHHRCGASCGANFNGLGATAGITIVGGHEFAETETDIFPNGGWLEDGERERRQVRLDQLWAGASANVTMNGASFPVQSLWSNAFNSNAGGCVQSF